MTHTSNDQVAKLFTDIKAIEHQNYGHDKYLKADISLSHTSLPTMTWDQAEIGPEQYAHAHINGLCMPYSKKMMSQYYSPSAALDVSSNSEFNEFTNICQVYA